MNSRVVAIIILLASALSCGNGGEKSGTDKGDFINQPTPGRATPIVYWWDGPAAIDTTEDIAYWFRQRDEPHGTYEISSDSSQLFIDISPPPINMDVTLRLSAGEQVEWWRVEWSPVADSCFYYLGGYAIPPGADKWHLPHSGVINVKIFGLQLGDRILFWRSHPWPGYENTPLMKDSLCMKPVR